MLSNADILRIIANDDIFLSKVFSSKSCKDFQIREIPRNSFTAFRLTYASPIDISLISKTLLLGGVPEYWYQEKRNRFWKVFFNLYTRKLQKSVKILSSNGYRRIYKECSKKLNKVKINNCKNKNYNSMKTDLPNTIAKENKIKPKHCSDEGTDKRSFCFKANAKSQISRRYSTGGIGMYYSRKQKSLDYWYQFHMNGMVLKFVNDVVNKDTNGGDKTSSITVSNYTKSDNYTGKHSKKKRKKRKNVRQFRRLIINKNKNHILLRLLDPVPETTLTNNINAKVLQSDTDDSYKGYMNFSSGRNNGKVSSYAMKKNHFYHFLKDQQNILLCDVALIMEKIGLTKEGPSITFNEDENIDTRIEEQWREYVTVLIETGDSINPLIVLCFKNSRKISRDTFCYKNKLYEPILIIPFNRSTIVNFYSSLDKTIAIQNSTFINKHGREILLLNQIHIHILQFQLTSTSFRWITLLREYFREQPLPQQLTLGLPEINKTICMNLPQQFLNHLKTMEEAESQVTKIALLNRGIHVFQSPFLRYLRVVVLKRLRSNNCKKTFKDLYSINSLTGCSMKTYDRIEWYPKNDVEFLKMFNLLADTHCLEFRHVPHYPLFAEEEATQRIREPTSVEGFLLRLINIDKSQPNYTTTKISHKSYYLYTSDNLLFYTSSYKGSPPLPSNITTDEQGSPAEYEKEFKKLTEIPDLFEQDPYELTFDSKFSWLTPTNSEEIFEEKDHFAFKCYNRKVSQILKSEGVIDISSICNVTKLRFNDFDHSILESISQMHSSFWNRNITLEELKGCIIVLNVKNNYKIQLLAPTVNVASMWVKTLNSMVEYWKQRNKLDIEREEKLRLENLTKFKLTPMGEGQIRDSTSKWLLRNAAADSLKFNINPISLLRPIIQKGLLFQKTSKHSPFHKYFVVLIPGFIILFKHTQRSFNTRPLEGYTHYETIAIKDCYLYSGTSGVSNLINGPLTFNLLDPGCQALPKLYEDECISIEEDVVRSFTLHFGKPYLLEKGNSDKHHTKEENTTWMFNKVFSNQIVTSKGKYKTMIFMSKCRSERDLWVLSLQQELERLNCKSLKRQT